MMSFLLFALPAASAETLPVSTVEWIAHTCGTLAVVEFLEVHDDTVVFTGSWLEPPVPLPPDIFLPSVGRDARIVSRRSPLYDVPLGETVVAAFDLDTDASGRTSLSMCHVFLQSRAPSPYPGREFDARGFELETVDQVLAAIEAWESGAGRFDVYAPVEVGSLGEIPLARGVGWFRLAPLPEHFPILREMALSSNPRTALRGVRGLSNGVFRDRARAVLEQVLDHDLEDAHGPTSHRDVLREAALDALVKQRRPLDDWSSVECAHLPVWDPEWLAVSPPE